MAESSVQFDVSPKHSEWDVMHEWVCCCDEAANHRLPIAAAFWIIWIVFTDEYSSLMQNLTQIHCSIHSVILNAMTAQCTCSLKSVYGPHWCVQWSRHCSPMHIPVHSPWLPGYIRVRQTVLIILRMAGLFLDKPDSILPISPSISCFHSCSLRKEWFCTINYTISTQPILHLLCFTCIKQESIRSS